MQVLVIGAHHGVGAHLVTLAQERGWNVTAFEGDVLDLGVVQQSMANQELVLSTLGPRPNAPTTVCSRGTSHIIEAMKSHGVRRLVQVTGAMIGHPYHKLGLVYRLIVSLVPKQALEDRREQERLVRTSGLDWTIVRPTRLTDGPALGKWRNGPSEVIGAFAHISRADVAQAMVQAAADANTIGRALTLQY